MAENKEIRSQRLAAIEKFATVVEASKVDWDDKKETAAMAKKIYEKNSTALLRMIEEKSDTPLFDSDS
ncbi:MAG: hypothetical protein SVV80_12590 [Planctomycetota bacterium]|nr:hypothetical protein [Planctomycetota bacterium]